MTPERWQRIKELLSDTLELPPSRRAAWLAEACAGDEALRQEATAYLAFQTESDEFMAQPACSLLARRPDTLRVDHRIGPYRILRPIGRGGVSVVYLAVREDGFVKKVALKLLRRGMATGGIVLRFEQERQILAQLDHPGIARLLDGGSTADGQPYFVMEHIVGERINRYCESRRLSISERLRLFRGVCSAVALAHRNRVVHRDLKPANILVTPEGEPKLLDFGIAKLLAAESSATGMGARGHLRPMTLAYASPEQLRGGVITTASDIFALGVLLWELLTGQRLYHFRSPDRLERAICDEEPPRPSTAVGRGSLAAAWLHRRLRGDLDSIVLKALAKEPAERYASVEQLAEDLGRHLNGLPVLARRGTPAYRAGRFVRRHWLRLGVAAAFLLLVLAFSVHARRQAGELDESLAATREVASVLDAVLAASASASRDGEAVPDEILKRAAAEVRRRLDARPEIKAALLESIACAYGDLGRYPRAAELLGEALRLREEALGGFHPETARTREDLERMAERGTARGRVN